VGEEARLLGHVELNLPRSNKVISQLSGVNPLTLIFPPPQRQQFILGKTTEHTIECKMSFMLQQIYRRALRLASYLLKFQFSKLNKHWRRLWPYVFVSFLSLLSVRLAQTIGEFKLLH
jgi:hypothetical protein